MCSDATVKLRWITHMQSTSAMRLWTLGSIQFMSKFVFLIDFSILHVFNETHVELTQYTVFLVYNICKTVFTMVVRYRISAPAPVNPESGHFSEIRPSRVPAKFLYLVCRMWLVQLQYVPLITGKTDAADLSGCVFIIWICVTGMIKIQNSLLFYKFP